jgi:hypothetical protein
MKRRIAEIAMGLAKRGHRVWISGRDVAEVPFRMEGLAARFLLARVLLRFVFHYVLTIRMPIGRKRRAVMGSKGAPLIRVKGGLPLLEDGTVLDFSNVVWSTESVATPRASPVSRPLGLVVPSRRRNAFTPHMQRAPGMRDASFLVVWRSADSDQSLDVDWSGRQTQMPHSERRRTGFP